MKPRSYPTATVTQKRARMILMNLLYGCTLERLKIFTAESLARSYNVPLPTVETMLDGARRGRGV